MARGLHNLKGIFGLVVLFLYRATSAAGNVHLLLLGALTWRLSGGCAVLSCLSFVHTKFCLRTCERYVRSAPDTRTPYESLLELSLAEPATAASCFVWLFFDSVQL